MIRRRVGFISLVSMVGLGWLVGTSPTCRLPVTSAQQEIAPCGYVEGFDFPVPNVDTERNDFGVFRSQFGGLHTGIDVAFYQQGEPVRAAARGRVTYSDIAGWDTELGVVVIQHTFPDGTLVNTLYGHMEESNDYLFPYKDQCVERGDIIGAVGDPSLSAPHLHYEIRTRYRYEGGPGYTEVNPLELGWLHPVDFTFLARVWIHPAYRQHFWLTEKVTLPLLVLADGTYVLARSAHLEGLTTDGQSLWQFDTLGGVTDMVALPDGRVLAATSADQVLVLNHGSYSALWPTPKVFITPPLVLGDAVVFMAEDRTLMALTPEGDVLWETGPLPDRAARWAASGDRLALALEDSTLVIVDTTGSVLHQETFADLPVPVAAPDGGFVLLSGSTISRLDETLTLTPVVDTQRRFTAAAELIHDPAGTLYIYTGEGRALYAYQSDGGLLWIAYMPGDHLRAPRLGVGGGSVLYALSTDGQLLAYATEDGRLLDQLALYNGGIDGVSSARWLYVQPDDTVSFSSGYLSFVTLDGLALRNH